MASSETFHFDEFTLDVRERRLLRGTETVRLSPKAYDVLVVLVRQSGRLVTKDELLAQVWPESFVEEGILNVHVAALRKALGDDTRPPAYIETVVRSGYRFIAAVRFDSGDEKPFAPSAVARPVELYELVGRGRSHLLSGSFFELPAAVDAFRSAIETVGAALGRGEPQEVRDLARVVDDELALRDECIEAVGGLIMVGNRNQGVKCSQCDWSAAEAPPDEPPAEQRHDAAFAVIVGA